MASFSSELDVKFPITLEADHVIDRKQVWVGTLSHGPTGHNLNATYRNTETLVFQDEIGKLVEGMCRHIPHGILVFLPSYKMLDNMVNRWQATGTWAGILDKKTIVREPRLTIHYILLLLRSTKYGKKALSGSNLRFESLDASHFPT